MKKIIILTFLCSSIMLLFAGCSSDSTVVTLGQYMDLEVEVSKKVVTDDDVLNAIIDDLTANQEYVEIKNRPVRRGDIANIDYSGKVDDIKFAGGTDTGYDLKIGSGDFIDGFEDQIIGMNLGETADINVTFPDPYPRNTDLSGAEVVFTVTVNSISGKEIPSEITDAMIKELTSDTYTTVEEYSKHVRLELEAEALEIDEQNKQIAVWNMITKNSTVENLSNKKIKYYSGIYESDYQYYADMNGVGLTDFIQYYVGISKEEYEADKKAYAESYAKNCAIVEAIAKEREITLSNSEYQLYLSENNISTDQKRQYGESIKDNLLYNKVMDLIISKTQFNII